jgi:cytochrome b6-f complex iron-sulfur subunit
VDGRENLGHIPAAHALHGGGFMESHKSSRREFCTHALTFVTAASLLESCGGSPTSPSSTAAALPTVNAVAGVNNTLTINIDSTPALAAVGSAALVQTSTASYLVARVAQDTFNAMTAVCTHEACTVSRFQSGTFQCPCHGSEYNTSGGVTKGPAPAALRRFSTQFTGGVLTISL